MKRGLGFVLGASIAAAPAAALALEHGLSGAAQLHVHAAPTLRERAAHPSGPRGFDVEATVRLHVDVSANLSATVKVCGGCHGLESEEASADFRLMDEVRLRVGRFSPTFGGLGSRASAAYRVASDAPLPYDMGRMLRGASWNLGVLPAPFPQEGVELGGSRWLRKNLQLDWAAHVSTGLMARTDGADIDWVRSRGALYYLDDNASPEVGGQARGTLRLGGGLDVSLGASFLHGAYGANAESRYTVASVDAAVHTARTTLRAEYLVRTHGAGAGFTDHVEKHGAYVELEHRLGDVVTGFLRTDMLARAGLALPGSDLPRQASVVRHSVGAWFVVERGFRVKSSVELWTHSAPDSVNQRVDASLHVAALVLF